MGKKSGPMLYEISLTKMKKVRPNASRYYHPDIEEEKLYLVKYYDRWYLGRFCPDAEDRAMRFYTDLMSFDLRPEPDWQKIYAVELDEKTSW